MIGIKLFKYATINIYIEKLNYIETYFETGLIIIIYLGHFGIKYQWRTYELPIK